MRRGEVVLIDLGEPLGSEAGFRRPAVVVSGDAGNAVVERRSRGTLTVVPVTSRPRRHRYAFHVPLPPGERTGLTVASIAQAEHVRSVDVRRVAQRLGRLDSDDMTALDAALRVHLDL